MFMKRPQNNAKFRQAINRIFNVKRYSLALDKRFHKYPACPYFTLLTTSLEPPT